MLAVTAHTLFSLFSNLRHTAVYGKRERKRKSVCITFSCYFGQSRPFAACISAKGESNVSLMSRVETSSRSCSIICALQTRLKSRRRKNFHYVLMHDPDHAAATEKKGAPLRRVLVDRSTRRRSRLEALIKSALSFLTQSWSTNSLTMLRCCNGWHWLRAVDCESHFGSRDRRSAVIQGSGT